MSKGIPGLRNPRGGGFSLLRHRNPYRPQIVEWFGSDLSTIAIVFREQDVTKLARTLLRAQRRQLASATSKKLGRPSRQEEAKVIILQLVEERRWSATQPLKALTQAVNRRAKCPNPISEDTVARALVDLHQKTGDRRFERLRRG